MSGKFKKFVSLVMLSVITITACGKEPVVEETEKEQTADVSAASTASTSDASAKEKYPVTWDLESIYASEEEWQADYDKVMEMLDGYDQFRGTLNNAQNIYDYFQFAYFTELTSTQYKLSMYAKLGNGLNATDPVFKNMLAKLDNMSREESAKNAFAEIEIFELSLEEREKIFSDPIFGENTYWLEHYTDPDYEPYTENETLIMSTLSMGLGYGENIFEILNNVELPYPTIKLPNGRTTELTEELYAEIVYGDRYNDAFKEHAEAVYYSRYEGFANTFAALLEENCSQAYAAALLDGYDTTLEYALSDYDLDTEVFDMLIEAAHDGIPEYQRYLNLHAEGLGLEEQHSYDMATSVSDYDGGLVAYDDAVDQVIDALGILGDDYIDHFKKIITSGHVDVYPTDTKSTGAYETKPSPEYYPWVLFNYTGYTDDVSTIAHEMGHAVYDQYSTENQPLMYVNPTIFTQEVASTTNELLYYEYMMKNAQSDDEKLFYLENALYMFAGTFFTQMMYSEFEDYMYKTVEAGESLDAEDLGDKWMELLDVYKGDTTILCDEIRYRWAAIPHLYYQYYVYQYSADVAYAASIAQRITSGEDGAVEEYLDFLKLGGSAPPVELLSEAGIDPLDKKTYDDALAYFTSLVDEYERLIREK
jgi:oligoendopeptidase F